MMRNDMTQFRPRSSFVIKLLLVFFSAVAAQPVLADTSSKIDPDARKLMEKMFTAYQNLQSYSGRMERSQEIKEEKTMSEIIYTWLKFKRPNLISVITKYGSYTVKSICNGKILFAANSKERSKYLKIAAPEGTHAFEKVFYEGDAFAPGMGIAMVARGENPLQTFDKAFTELTIGTPEIIGGTPVETVVAKIGTEPITQKIIYSIGRNDCLLRRVKFIWPLSEGRTWVLTKTHYDVKINPDLPNLTFTFSPPPKAKPVKSLP